MALVVLTSNRVAPHPPPGRATVMVTANRIGIEAVPPATGTLRARVTGVIPYRGADARHLLTPNLSRVRARLSEAV